tara:strand:- start:497 stop:2146 length:1650 start_codon:yes stop_codon:yes gene_type:complete
VTSILFVCFYNYLFFFGRNVLKIISKKNKTIDKIFVDENLRIFYPIFSLFLIGNIIIILNFLFPITIIFPFILAITVIFMFYGLVDNLRVINYLFLIKNIFIPGILSISVYGSRLHYDSGAYHLNNQLWIRESNLVIGLSNIIQNYGFSSISEYLSSVLWFNNNFIFIFFFNLIFFTLYFNFLFENLFEKTSNFLRNSSIVLIIYSFIDNFGFNGGGNGTLYFQTVSKPDMPMATVFIITTLLLFNSLMKKEYEKKYLYLYIYLVFFAIQIKLFAIYLTLPLLIYIYFYRKEKNLSAMNIIFENKILLIFVLSWMSKNIFVSGCLFYPVEFTCFSSLSWYESGDAEELRSNISIIFSKEYFSKWFANEINVQVYVNFLGSIVIISILNFILFQRKQNIGKIEMIFLTFLLLIFISWMLTSPKPRWGVPIFSLFIVYTSVFFDHIKLNKSYLSILMYFCFSISLFLTPRLYSYQFFINNLNMIYENYTLRAPEIEYEKTSYEWGVFPKDNDIRCWVKIDCMFIDKNVKPEEIFGFTIFYPDKTLVELLNE